MCKIFFRNIIINYNYLFIIGFETHSRGSNFRYEEIEFYLQNLARDHPDFVKRSVKGQTIEGRNITVMKIGTSPSGDETRAVWFDAGNTWISI